MNVVLCSLHISQHFFNSSYVMLRAIKKSCNLSSWEPGNGACYENGLRLTKN